MKKTIKPFNVHMNAIFLRNTLALLVCVIVSQSVSAQFKVGDNPTDVHPAAALQVESANQGVLLPRINDTAVVPLPLSPNGMIIYYTDTFNAGINAGLYVRRAGRWYRMETAGSGWQLTGNAGTDTAVNFIGTTDNMPLRFRVDNQWLGELKLYTVAMGLEALGKNQAVLNVAYGPHALKENVVGSQNVAVGPLALRDNESGQRNVAVGHQTLTMNTAGEDNTALGALAMSNSQGSNNTAVGSSALESNTTGNANTAIGANTGPVTGTLDSTVSIGAGARAHISHAIVLGDTTNHNIRVGIGRSAPEAKLHVRAAAGNDPLKVEGLPSGGATDSLLTVNTTGVVGKKTVNSIVSASAWSLTGNAGTDTAVNFIGTTHNMPIRFRVNNQKAGTLSENNTAFGYQALEYNTTGNSNVAIGGTALRNNQVGVGNVAVGRGALTANTSGLENTAVGDRALANNTTGVRNVAMGVSALINSAEGNDNVAIGPNAMSISAGPSYSNVAVGPYALQNNNSGSNNVAVGVRAAIGNTVGGGNVAIGDSALAINQTGSYNIAIGRQAGVTSSSLSKAVAIGYNAQVSKANAMVLGDTTDNLFNVGIGRSTPQAKLHVRATTGNNPLILEGTPAAAAADSILTINAATGVVGRRTVSSLISGGWSLTGNSGTTGANFIGTTDNAPLSFRVDNYLSGIISSNGNTALGFRSLETNTTGTMNIAIGAQALLNNDQGSYNIAIGNLARVGFPIIDGHLNNAVAIGSNAVVRRSNTMVLGDTTLNGFNVGIGRSMPQAKLHVKATSGNRPLILEGVPSGAVTDSLLTINATTGEINKRTVQSMVSATAWGLAGNAGTDTTTNFIGTTDNMPLRLKVKNEVAGIVSERNTAIGYQALMSNQRDGLNTAVGVEAMKSNSAGAWNAALGYQAMISNTGGNYNVALGALTLTNNQVGNENTALGSQAASTTTGSRNTAVGRSALASNTTGSDNTAIGANANVTANNLTNATAIGANARVNRSNTVVLGDTGVNNLYVGIGRGAPEAKLHVRAAAGHNPLMLEGLPSGAVADSVLTVNGTTGVVGKRPVGNLVTGLSWGLTGNAGTNPAVNFIGTTDEMPLTFKIDSTLAGLLSMNNTSFGYGALLANTTGVGNVGIGTTALMWNTAGANNLSIGTNSMVFNTTGTGNVGIGYQALDNNTTGSYNVGIGYQAKTLSDTLTNTVGIGARVRVGRSNSIVLGDTTVNELNVGIGRSRPQAKLHVRATGGNNPLILEGTPSGVAADSILTINATTGVVGRRTVSSMVSAGAWSLTGNAGTDTSVHFIGTTDNTPLLFRANNIRAGIISGANTALGTGALRLTPFNDVGGNVSIGAGSLYDNLSGVANVAVGANALYESETSSYNTAVGQAALQNAKSSHNIGIGYRAVLGGNPPTGMTGEQNIGIGSFTLNAVTTGAKNIAIGHAALRSITSTGNNIAIGDSALYANNAGIANTAVGSGTLRSNTNGTGNVAVGYEALKSGGSGNYNVAVGPLALMYNTGSSNMAMGYAALILNTTGNSNIAIGYESMQQNTSGQRNIAIGTGALKTNSTGTYNVSIGDSALLANVADENTAIGAGAMKSNTSGNKNTAIGRYAMRNVQTGVSNIAIGHGAMEGSTGNYLNYYNVAIGERTLFSNQTGANNTAINYSALQSNTTGNDNIAVGRHAMTSNQTGSRNIVFGADGLSANVSGSGNIAIGVAALKGNLNGGKNVAIGDSALFTTGTSPFNVAVGADALRSNTSTQGQNTAVGYRALFANTTGYANVAVGVSALGKNTEGIGNVGMGPNALQDNTTGDDNMAIGNQSNRLNVGGGGNVSIGSYSLWNNVAGNYNTAIGMYALRNTTGNYNTAIGYEADVPAGMTEATAIGYNAVAYVSNSVTIGRVGLAGVYAYATYNNISDARFKEQVQENVPGLELIKRLKPVTYHLNARMLDGHIKGKPVADSETYQHAYNKLHTGFLAQDVEAICKELGFDFDAVSKPENERGHYSLSYSQFIMPLVKAVQEQQEMIERQQAENTALQQRLEAQQKTLDAILDRLEQMDRR